MSLSDFLAQEWRPALGCTEPAAIAYAAANAASAAGGAVKAVHLVCDARNYKNCYAVGIPHSGRKTGILWAAAIGALLPDPSAKLECFRQINDEILGGAERLIQAGAVTAQVDTSRRGLHLDCRVVCEKGVGRALIEHTHTGLSRVERDGELLPISDDDDAVAEHVNWREKVGGMSMAECTELARTSQADDRDLLRHGCELNLRIANHGLSLFPKSFVSLIGLDQLTRISRLVCAGVYARMCGEDYLVMSVAGSGNKGITVSVPLVLWGRENGFTDDKVFEALALGTLVTSAVTQRLGTLSAVCGCSNAAGIGLAAGLVHLQGGGSEEISRAVNNMVGNVTGMICDGAKIGCGLKTMTSVDSAFRAASLAMAGIGIPYSDGIVGENEAESLANLERIASLGMHSMDEEILNIMQKKLG